MKIYQQNIFGGEDLVNPAVPVIVFKHTKKEGRYLAASIDFVDWDDEDGDVTMENIDGAFMIFKQDRTTPGQRELEETLKRNKKEKQWFIEQCGPDAHFSLDLDVLLGTYEPVNIDIPHEKFERMLEMMEW